MSYQVELGWTVITPCSKVEWTPTSIPGVSTPTLKFAEQRLYLYAIIDGADSVADNVHQAMKECSIASIGAAGGIAAITANPGAAVAAFKTAFIACFSAKFAEIGINDVHLTTEAVCMW